MAGKLEDRVREIIVDQLGVNAEQVTTEASPKQVCKYLLY